MFNYSTRLGEIKYFSTNGSGPQCMQNPQPCLGNQTYFTHRLKEVNFEAGYVKFNYFSPRCDIPGDKMLDEIELFTKDHHVIKKYVLSHSYFGDDGTCNYETANAKRLKLNSISEWSNSSKHPPYIFSYNEDVLLPDRMSTAQDHWGYFNGKQNAGLIAGFSTVSNSGAQIYFSGADRRTDPANAQAGILTKIQYPSGGQTLFQYESNTVNDNRFEPFYEQRLLSYSAANYLVSSLPNPLGATPLILPPGGAQVEFKNIAGLDQLWPGCDVVECWVTRNGQRYRRITNSLNGAFELWPEGTYGLVLQAQCGEGSMTNFNVLVAASVPIDAVSDLRPVGGLRVKKIEDIPGNGGKSVIREYRYEQVDDPTKSSGVLINFPQYGYDLEVVSYATDEHNSVTGPSDLCSYRVRSSFSNYPLATTNGGYVGYSHVIEDLGASGETHFLYTTYADPIPQYPFAPVEYFDWRRGFLSNIKLYTRINDQIKLVKETTNSPIEINEFRVYGIKTGRKHLILKNGAPIPSQGLPVYTFYPTISSFFGLMRTTEKTYDPLDKTKWVETIQENTYSSKHLQITASLTTTSNGSQTEIEEIVVTRKYPFDYIFTASPIGAEAEGIKKLQDLHMVSTVIDEFTMKQNRNKANNQVSNQRVIAGMLSTFRNDKPYPDRAFILEAIEPVALNIFGSSSSVLGNSFLKNEAYQHAASYIAYDEYGNILTTQKPNNVSSSYVWGYGFQFPIAAVTNCSNLNDIAQTSFETESAGNWEYNLTVPTAPSDGRPMTGEKCFPVSSTNTILKSNLTPSTQYTLAFWYKAGSSIIINGGTQTNAATVLGPNDWILSTRNITGASSIAISGTGIVDELRLFPLTAQMISYTYDPMIGVTSETDQNARPTYYSYDNFGRLKMIKDIDGNILKRYEYNYQAR
ncbi:MAG TPA: hypothetical protein VGD65_00275 [Chryseosolibacter sp.]